MEAPVRTQKSLIFILTLRLALLSFVLWTAYAPLQADTASILESINTQTITPLDKIAENITLDAVVGTMKTPSQPKAAVVGVQARRRGGAETQDSPVTQCYQITPGIPETVGERIAIYCGGANPIKIFPAGGGTRSVHVLMRDHMLPIPCVTYDKPEGRTQFNWAQDIDIGHLKCVYEAVLERNPHAKITLIGLCLGGLTIFRFIAQNPELAKNVDTIILQSPAESAQAVIKQVAHTWLRGQTGVLRRLIKRYYTLFDKKKDTLDIEKIRDKKILIAHLTEDKIISNSSINKLVIELRKQNTVYLVLVGDKSEHGQKLGHCLLTPDPTFQKAVNCFYKQTGIPVPHPGLAYQGKKKKLLERAAKAVCE